MNLVSTDKFFKPYYLFIFKCFEATITPLLHSSHMPVILLPYFHLCPDENHQPKTIKVWPFQTLII
jgi:hypothetical protein